MSTLTIRIPDDKYERLKEYAKEHKISLNKLFNELATTVLAQYDAEIRFKILASKGDVNKGLKILDKLDESLK